MNQTSILIKLGGTAASSVAALEALADDLVAAPGTIAIVHGGGKEVSELSRRFGLEPVFHNGVRMTSEAEMDAVEMVLSGVANKRLVRRLSKRGLPAVGISGADAGLLVGTRVPDPAGALSRTATIASVNPKLVRDLWSAGYVPVISSPGSDANGEAVNINADDAAFALAGALEVGSLLFVSDVPGVIIENEPVVSLTPAMAAAGIGTEQISGGMVPKVQNAITALAHGVAQVVIGNYERTGDLRLLLEGKRGTAIVAEDSGTAPNPRKQEGSTHDGNE
ncbi:MAG: acetylglutamate kinase [Spirochaetota bacterium]